MPYLLGLRSTEPELTISEQEPQKVETLRHLGGVTVPTVGTELVGVHGRHDLAASPDTRHVIGQIVRYLDDQGVALLQPVDHLAPVDHGGSSLSMTVHPISGLFLVQTADFLDLLQSRQHPLVVGLQLLDTLVQPAGLLLLPVLGAGVVQDLDVGRQGLVHDLRAGLHGLGQGPEQLEDLVRHHPVLVVLGQPPDQLQQLLPLSGHGGRPPTVLETLEQMIQLFRGEVPSKFCQQVVNILHNGLMFPILS